MFTHVKNTFTTQFKIVSLSLIFSLSSTLNESLYAADQSYSIDVDHITSQGINPDIIHNYKNALPKLEVEHAQDVSFSEKAQYITQYLCQFMPSKVTTYSGTEKLQAKISSLIEQDKPLTFSMCGFPFKSSNRTLKCFTNDADLSDYLAFLNVQTMLENIQLLYTNVHCVIRSDGLAYHIDIDPSYEDILAYHAQLETLSKNFPLISFVSWKVHKGLNSYEDLQAEVSLIPTKPVEKKQLKHMKVFVERELACTFWSDHFQQLGQKAYEQLVTKPSKLKQQKQALAMLVNRAKKEKIESAAKALSEKSAQYSTYLSQFISEDALRLTITVFDTVDVSHRLPISLVHNHFGAPWHNALVVGVNGNVKGFYRGVDLSKEVFQSCTVDVDGVALSLKYILGT